MAQWFTALILAGVASVQAADDSVRLDRALRTAARGTAAIDDLRLETQCLDGGRFVQAAAYGSGIAIWNGERQGTLTRAQALAVVKAFARERFASMPASFGGEEDEGRRMAVKMTCRVRAVAGGVSKDVIQLEEGRQSRALKRLATAILDAARAATQSSRPIHSLDEGLTSIAAGRLAIETLRITLRSGGGAGVRDAGRAGWVIRLDGHDLEVEPDGGPLVRRRLPESDVRELARVLADGRFAQLPVNIRTPDLTDVTVAVLGHEHGVQARPFAGESAQPEDIEARFQRAVAPLMSLRRQ